MSSPSPPTSTKSFLHRTFSSANRGVARQFFSAYAQTWVGLSPVWLMGEALTPGTKIGAKFKQGRANLVASAEQIRQLVTVTASDVIVIIDQKLGQGKLETTKTAEVIKAAGLAVRTRVLKFPHSEGHNRENAILVVTSSLDRVQMYLSQSQVGPEVKKSISKNGRDVIVVIDKALKHPLIITGVSKFAKSKGIPHAEALLRLASLGLAKILKAIPDESRDGLEDIVEEVDASDLAKASSYDENQSAIRIGQEGQGKPPQEREIDPYAQMKKGNQCLVM